MDSDVICNPKKALTDSLTNSLYNMDLRDAGASKNRLNNLNEWVSVVSDMNTSRSSWDAN